MERYKKNSQICFVFIYLSSSDLHSEQARIEVHETNTRGTHKNVDSSNLYQCSFLDGLGGGNGGEHEHRWN